MNLKAELSDGVYQFNSVKKILTRANGEESGGKLAGIVTENALERTATKEVLSQLTIADLRNNPVVDYNEDEIARVIQDAINEKIHNEIKNRTVVDLREYITGLNTGDLKLERIFRELASEVIAGITKLTSNTDLIYAAKELGITAACNTTTDKRGTLAVRLQSNHTADDIKGIEPNLHRSLAYGMGNTVLGLNSVDDSIDSVSYIYNLFREVKSKWKTPARTCVLIHVITVMEYIKHGVSVDLVFQSIVGSQKRNEAFGSSDKVIEEAYELALKKGTALGPNAMYFETGQGSELSPDAHRGADQLVTEARCYDCTKKYNPYPVNTVVGFIGSEHLYNSKQVIRAGLEGYFMDKLISISMGVDICHTNHMKTGANDPEILAILLGVTKVNYVIGIPGRDDIMLNYQTSSYQDDATLRALLNHRPIRGFGEWTEKVGFIESGEHAERSGDASIFFDK